ncbi:super-infection exclusion protein B [Citrobacter portucalensis]|uniref:Super-infection exclusion protein B n=2 Tax=Citrobacter portucalensis TaxID=1639133 RepID=A0ABD5H7I6_9ENTR|nr:super-infection exclusion protein B [Citrobacter portucalensis]
MIFKPQQFESIKMEPLAILGRVFSNEPLERTMYMIVLWIAFLVLSPDSWAAYVDEKTGIPHIWHLLIFALAFLLAINIQKASRFALNNYHAWRRKRERRARDNKIRTVIANLTEAQSMVLCAALNEGRQAVITKTVFPHIEELIQLGVLNKTFSRWQGKLISFPIEDVYWTELVASFDPYNIEIKPRPIAK